MATIERSKRLTISIAEGFGVAAVVDSRNLFAPVDNDTGEAVMYADVAASVVGEVNVRRDGAPSMASEVLSGNGPCAAVRNRMSTTR